MRTWKSRQTISLKLNMVRLIFIEVPLCANFNRKMRLVRCRSSVILHCDFSVNLTHPCAISGSLFFLELQFLNFYRCQTNRNSDYFGVQSRYFSFVLYIKSFIHTLNRYLQLSLAVVKHFQTQTIHSENRLDHLEHFLFG